jgi:hypothetical protein
VLNKVMVVADEIPVSLVALRAYATRVSGNDRIRLVACWITGVALAAIVVRHGVSSWRGLPDRRAPFGSDFRMNLWGPAILTSEGRNPWLPANSVPRFGIYSPSPVLPASYLLFPLFKWWGLVLTLQLWVTASLAITVVATRRVAKGLGLSNARASLMGLIVAISPVAEYNVNLAQFGVVALAACAIVVPMGVEHRTLHFAERCGYVMVIAVMFGKPTHAATLLLAELVFRRSIKWAMMAGAALVAMSALSFGVISARSGISVATLIRTMLDTAHNFADEAGSLGSRTDFLSEWTSSLVFDICAALAAIVGAKIVSDSTRLTLVQRFAVAMCLLTAFSYHHIYDTLPVLVALCALAFSLRGLARWVLVGALVLCEWLATPPLVGRFVARWLDVRWFDFRARLVFVLCVVVSASIIVNSQSSRRAGTSTVAPTGA